MNCRQNSSHLVKLARVSGFVLLIAAWSLNAAEVRVAVASNFYPTLQILAAEFERDTGHSILAIPGSTGKHFAQIINGAPFDMFLAADVERPKKLLATERFHQSRLKIYAIGNLVLWKPGSDSARQAEMALFSNFKHLALANPRLAPYGAAAQSVLAGLGLVEKTKERWVMGENIAQAFQFVATGNAELGFVAEAQLRAARELQKNDLWRVPKHLYPPINQAAMLLNETPHGLAFFEFLASERALQIIVDRGYDRPQ